MGSCVTGLFRDKVIRATATGKLLIPLVTLLWNALSVNTAHAQDLWDHNGSTVRLQKSENIRKFHYAIPRTGLSVQPGTLLFEGTQIGNRYAGSAYVFSSQCGRLGYAVNGTESEEFIKLYGKRPRRGANCAVVEHSDEMLLFSVQKRVAATSGPLLTETILNDPHSAVKVIALLLRSSERYEPAKNDEKQFPVGSCTYPLNTVYDDIGEHRNFFGHISSIADSLNRLTAVFKGAGYPEQIWKMDLENLITARTNEVVRRKSLGLVLDVNTEVRDATINYQRNLVRSLNKYRDERDQTLLKFFSEEEMCGADFVRYVQLRTDPPGGTVRVIREFYFKVCQALDKLPYSADCDKWHVAALDDPLPEGIYYYLVRWPSGHIECARRHFVGSGELITRVITASGEVCSR